MNAVTICNLALSFIGHSTQITALTPADGTREAALCSQFYPIARDAVLASHEWGFATRRVALALVGTAPEPWTYQYAQPSDAISVLRVYEPESRTSSAFIEINDATHGTVILTDVEDADVEYLIRVTDPTKFSAPFAQAVAWTLAAYLAGPLSGDVALAQTCRDRAAVLAGMARVADANRRVEDTRAAIQGRFPLTYRPRG